MINSFKNYLVEEEKTVYFTFGRMNPPTIGHEKLLDVLAQKAGKHPYKVYLSQTQDIKKNPLEYQSKVKLARKMFPRHARSIIIDRGAKNVFDIITKLYDEGYKNVAMVVGSDRVREFDILLNKYNGKKGKHGFYNFAKITVISAGDRDPDAEGAEGMSASKMRAAASNGDFSQFAQGLPKSISNAEAKKTYNMIRSAMGLKEQKSFKNKVTFEPVNDLRESYMDGKLFAEGEEVVIKDNGIIGEIKHLGSNYLIIESKGERYRKWLTQVERVNPNQEIEYEVGLTAPGYMKEDAAPQDPDIAKRKGTQPAKYHAGLKKSTKVKRDAQFKKQSKMADDDPKAYKPAPGDKTAKTKPSKYTVAVKKMVEEDGNPEITVGNYNTTHFYMCPSARKAMVKHSKVDGAEQLTKMQDDYFKFEKKFMSSEPSASDKAKAITDYKKIMAKAKEAGIEKDVKAYMDMHRDSITKGDPKPGFGIADIKEYKMEMPKKRAVRFKSFGEQDTAVDIAKKKIDREKQTDARRHDRMMDRARMKVTRRKNRETK